MNPVLSVRSFVFCLMGSDVFAFAVDRPHATRNVVQMVLLYIVIYSSNPEFFVVPHALHLTE